MWNKLKVKNLWRKKNKKKRGWEKSKLISIDGLGKWVIKNLFKLNNIINSSIYISI